MADPVLPDISDREWEKSVERSEIPVFVMFYSPLCKHCVQILPHIEKLAEELGDRVRFLKLNTIQYEWLAQKYGVLATPTFQIFCGGKPVQTRVGAVFPAMLRNMAMDMIEHGNECLLKSSELKYEITGYG